jgi:hypothetical protein
VKEDGSDDEVKVKVPHENQKKRTKTDEEKKLEKEKF